MTNTPATDNSPNVERESDDLLIQRRDHAWAIDPHDRSWLHPESATLESPTRAPTKPRESRHEEGARVSILVAARGDDHRLLACVESLTASDLHKAGRVQVIVAPYGANCSAMRYRQLLRPFLGVIVAEAPVIPFGDRLGALANAFSASNGAWILSMNASDVVSRNFVDQLLDDATHHSAKMVAASCSFLSANRVVRVLSPSSASRERAFGIAELIHHADSMRALIRRDAWAGVKELLIKVRARARQSLPQSDGAPESYALLAWDQVIDTFFHALGTYVCGRSIPLSRATHSFRIDAPPTAALRHDLISQWWRFLHDGWTLPPPLQDLTREFMLTNHMYALQMERRVPRLQSYAQFLAGLDTAAQAA